MLAPTSVMCDVDTVTRGYCNAGLCSFYDCRIMLDNHGVFETLNPTPTLALTLTLTRTLTLTLA